MLERTPTQLLAAMANAALLAILFLPASAEAQTTGTIKASDGATLELVEDDDAKDSDATTGAEKKAEPAAELTLPAGTHTVIYRRDGYYPIKGQVTVTAGGSSTISAAAEKVPERKELEAWSVLSLTAGSAALLTAFVLELSGEEESIEASTAKFSLVGVGTVLMVSGGVILKWVRTERTSPEARDGIFQLSAGPLQGGGFLSASGSF